MANAFVADIARARAEGSCMTNGLSDRFTCCLAAPIRDRRGMHQCQVLALTDRLGTQLAAADEARMHERFRTTSRYEWMFWEMGYRQESWPVA